MNDEGVVEKYKRIGCAGNGGGLTRSYIWALASGETHLYAVLATNLLSMLQKNLEIFNRQVDDSTCR
jgi:hypothetical protein